MTTLDPERFDHAVLDPGASEREIVDAAHRCAEASVRGLCVAPCRARVAAGALAGAGTTRLVVVAGFPGAHARADLVRLEAIAAVEDGAREVDLVLPTGRLLDGEVEALLEECAEIVDAIAPTPVKLIVEVSRLDDALVARAIEEIVVPSGAAFLKTGTGVYGRPLEVPRIRRIRERLPASVRLKVAGGIRDAGAAVAAIAAGADVVGTSRTFAILGGVSSS